MRDHTSLIAWQEARRVSREVIRLAQTHWQPHLKAVYDQLQRAALSVQLNIGEGYALSSPPLFRRHLRIAYGSAIETLELLDLLVELGSHETQPIEDIRLSSQRSQRLLLGLLHSIRTEKTSR
jgi:four helix bundle protein